MARPSAKHRIEQAALPLFVQKGVAATSVRDIAAAAGVSEGALYRHFTGKDELVAALFAERYAALARQLDALAGTGSFAERLSAVIEGLCALHDREPDAFNFMLVVQHEQLPRYDNGAGSPVDALRGIIATGIATGDVRVTDAELATGLVLGIVVQPATLKLYGRITRPMSALAPTLAAAALRALGCAAAPARDPSGDRS
jgi:AcrR family transcriptional regulator